MAGALEGVRVLDCTQIIAGPLAGSLLTEMGADVVKVEPLEGEPWRLQAEIIPKESRGYHTVNRGKRGITLDMKSADSRPIREALIRWADVLLTNYRPGVPEQLGIDYETAKAIKPDIIYCENTAFGKKGPDAFRRGYDIVAQAMSGVTTSNPNLNEDGLPQQVGFAPSDVVTGVAMAWAITAALYHKARTGEGQAINSSLLLSGLFIQAGAKEIVAMDGEVRAHRLSLLEAARARGANMGEIIAERRALMPELGGNIYYRPYQTADGYIVVGCLGPLPRQRFREALKMRDPRYEEGFDRSTLKEVGAKLVAEAEAQFRSKTSEEWLAILDSFGVASGPVRFVDELWEDAQVAANGYIVEYEHTLLGPMRGNAPVVSMSATPTRVQRGAPTLGEHTDQVLAELGFSETDIATMRRKAIVL